MKRLKRKNAELRRANGILKAASAFFVSSSTGPGSDRGLYPRARRPPAREGLRWGVEPNCAVLTEHGVKIALSTYYEWKDSLPSKHEDRVTEPNASG